MKAENDCIIFESRQEVSDLQDALEIFIEMSKSVGEEDLRKAAKNAAALLDAMYLSW